MFFWFYRSRNVAIFGGLLVNFVQVINKALYQAGSVLRKPAAVAMLALVAWSVLSSVVPGTNVAYAQNTNATIRGQVLDPTGALVANANVVITNKNTGVTVFNGKTDSAGAFVAPQVIPGTYKVTVSAPGLKDAVIDNLVATVAQVASVDVNMQVGAATEVVTVQAKGEELDRSTSDVSTLISPEDVQYIPLQTRQTENLLAFIPGVVHGGAGDTPSTSQLSINGSRTLNTEVLLNGVSTIVASTGTPGTLPSPDGVDQFRVITTNAPAEYGRTSGAVISVNTISGTNAYHGNLYFLLRNEAFEANQYFHKDTINATTGAVTPRNRDRFFQEGGSFGGPIRIPHLYNGRDKTFFFFNYDRTVTPSSTLLTFTTPTAAQRTGDLSNALATTDANGNKRTPQPIFQPGGVNNLNTPQFTNNQVGPIDPAAAKILALLPLPNTVGTYDAVNNRFTGNWTSLQNLTGHVQKIVGRLDEVLTPKDRLSFNVFRFTTSTPNAVSWNSPLLNTTWDCTCNNAWLPSIDYTRVWTPTLVMDLNMGFFRNVVLRNPPGAGMNAAQQLGIASLPLDQTPEITDPGFNNIGADTNTNQVNITNTYTPFGTVTKTYGPHTFKVGGSLRKNQFNSFNPATSPEGSIAFDGSITNHGASGNPNTGIADFLLGKIKTTNYEQAQPPTGRRNYNFGIFAQDDWKVMPKLTLNLGIRYEYESPLTIATNIYSRIDPNTGILLAAGLNGVSRSLNINTPRADFSPRIGLAYAVNDKTVVRAAFGTFYGTIFQNLGGQLAYPGFDNTITTNNLGTGAAQPFSLSQGLPLAPPPNLQNPFAALVGSSASNPYSPQISFNDQSHMPLVQQWNLGFQRQLPLLLTLEVNYVGNHALHLSYNLNENQVPLSAVPAVTLANSSVATQNALQFPNLKSFTVNSNIGSSNYNGLQVTVRRQFNSRLAVLSNYTYSKSMDDGSTIYNFSAPNGTANSQYPVAGANLVHDFAVSNIDSKHVANIVMIYTTPGPWWLRNWHISPVFVGHTGLPFNVTQSNEIPGSSQRPNGDPRLLKLANPTKNGAALQYFDSAADPNFPLTPSGPVYNTINGVRTQIVATGFGNVGRDSNRIPGEVDFDASVSKDFKIWEALGFQFRVDAFNVINHTNFQAPSTASPSLNVTAVGTTATFATTSAFGKITGTQPNRQLQVSARFFF
jgi:Carboxypeptidase regulatory-like domain/TonB dependent receptor/TonB-dependent Receptor Plug Domain